MANGAEGFIIVSGALYKLNTTGLTAGATVYLSPTTAGAVTTTKPQAPDQLVVIGWVERVDNNVGSIYVKIDNGYELDELHDVQINSPQSGNLLIYDATTTPVGVWKNANLTDGTGITITEGAGSVTITNAAPDQTVVLTAGTGISTSGTYPNFTITNTAPSSGGTVTSVGGTGTVNGITLSGTVTSSGNLTLGGTLSGVNLATQVTGTLPITNGGTGQTTANAAFNALSPLTTLGDIIYEETGGIATRLAGNTTTAKQFLSQTGTGSVSAAPVWSALPTVLPVLNRAGSTVSVAVGNGVLPVLNRAGGTVNVAIN
jgi:uncharacterized protein with beta-barrel porin domain